MSRQRLSPTLKLYLLGSFHLEDEKGSIPLPTGKVQSLFAYLALHPGKHARDKLAGLYWGDSSNVRARTSLRATLKKLRKYLDARVLLTDRTRVQMNPALRVWVDALEFHTQAEPAPEAAVALYRGDLLAEFYDDWIVPEREHYRELYLGALLQLTGAARTVGEYENAVRYAQQVLTVDPANERAHQHLMFCYLALGRRSAALKQYGVCAKALQTELAVVPSNETTALYQWIQQDSAAQTPFDHRSAVAPLTNLPIPVSSFIGRKKELTDLKQSLMTTRLLTLSGAGGSGKTRLAIQVATDLIDSFHDGVWWIDLAPSTDAAQLPRSIAQVLGVRDDAPTFLPRIQNQFPAAAVDMTPQPLTETLAHFLREKQLLLVLDNCEHLVGPCARLADTLLTHCPNLQILATSREPLGITGEKVCQVPTMALPTINLLPQTVRLLEFEGIRLFCERASAVNAAFALTEQNAAAVLEICGRLDGIPLALELAAARTGVLSAEQIAGRLNDRFALLTQGSRTALPRHQTLRETIEWSHNLLGKSERILFRRLAVFADGFTLEAAQAVCGGAGIPADRMLDELSHLVDKSLVIVNELQPGTRYRLLDTIREFAREKLNAAGEAMRLGRRHRDFFIALAEKAEPKLRSKEQFEWLALLEVEHANWCAAWDHAIESDTASALRLVSALLDFWLIRGNPSEGRAWLTKLVERTRRRGNAVQRARALNVAGRLAHHQSDLVVARPLLEQSLSLARASGDKKEIAFALLWLGRTALNQREYDTASALARESFALYQALQDESGIVAARHRLAEMGTFAGFNREEQRMLFMQVLGKYRDRGDRYMAAQVLNAMGEHARLEGDYEGAGTFYEQALEILTELGRFPTATPLFNLAWVSLHRGDYHQALGFFESSLELHREYGYRKGMVEECLGGIAAMLGMTGKLAPAARLFGAVEALLENTGIAHWIETPDQMEIERHIAAVRAQLDAKVFETAWAEGRTLRLEQALAYALEESRLEP